MLIAKNIKKDKFIKIITYIFWISEHKKIEKWEEIIDIAFKTEYQIWAGCADIGIVLIPSKNNIYYGYLYTTISRRTLIYLPEKELLLCLDMDNSVNFKGDLEDWLETKFAYVEDETVFENLLLNEAIFLYIDRIPTGTSSFLADNFYVNSFDKEKAKKKKDTILEILNVFETEKKIEKRIEKLSELLKKVSDNDQRKIYHAIFNVMLSTLPPQYKKIYEKFRKLN